MKSEMEANILKVLITEEELHRRVAEMGEELYQRFEGKNPLFLGVLKGSFVFMADLVRACQYAKETGARQITLSGFVGGKIKEYSDAAFVVPLESYERIEDLHLMILHMIVCYFKNNPQLFEHDPVRGI